MQQLPVRIKRKSLSSLFTTLAIILFLSGFYLIDSMFLAGSAWYIKLIVVLLFLALSLGCTWLTSHKERIFSLFYGARIELYKVHWPSKDNSIKMTMMVLAIVAIFAIFLSIIDWSLALIIRGIM